MVKYMECNIDEMERVCSLGKALSSPVRLEMLQLLYENSLIIGEIAKKMDLPVSSTAFHLKILEQAGLIRMEEQPGTRGTMKLCTRKVDIVSLGLVRRNKDINEMFSAELPVGAFSSCRVSPTCGLCAPDGVIGNEDKEFCFYYPERMKAGLLWTSSGYVEYRFANGVPADREVTRLLFSAELCSEAPGYREDWKSDITLWVNETDCGTFTSAGDFGGRRGRLTPSIWPDGSSQYGQLTEWEVRGDGTYINGIRVSDTTIGDLNLMNRAYVAVRLGNREDAKYVGGLNLFGKQFGDYAQDLVLTMEYL